MRPSLASHDGQIPVSASQNARQRGPAAKPRDSTPFASAGVSNQDRHRRQPQQWAFHRNMSTGRQQVSTSIRNFGQRVANELMKPTSLLAIVAFLCLSISFYSLAFAIVVANRHAHWAFLTYMIAMTVLIVCVVVVIIAFILSFAITMQLFSSALQMASVELNLLWLTTLNNQLQLVLVRFWATLQGVVGGTLARIRNLGTLAFVGAVLLGFYYLIRAYPSQMAAGIAGFNELVWTPIFDAVFIPVNAIRIVLDVLVPWHNLVIWTPRGFINFVWVDSVPCILEHFRLALLALGNFALSFVNEMFGNWVAGGVGNSPLDVRVSYVDLQTALMETRRTLFCSCEAITFLGYAVYVPFTPLPSLSQVKTWGAFSFFTSRQVRSLGLGAQYPTPAIVDMFSNYTAFPFNLLVHVPVKAVQSRSFPDFNVPMNNLGNATLSAAKLMDQSIQGLLWLGQEFATHPTGTMEFNHTMIDYEPTLWPPVFELQSRIPVTYIKISQQLLQFVTNFPIWGQPEAWNLDILFTWIIEYAAIIEQVADTVLSDAQWPLARYTGAITRTGIMAVTQSVRFLYDSVVWSLVGGIEAIEGNAPWSMIIHDLNQKLYLQVTTTWLQFADAAGAGFGYSVGQDQVTVVNNSFVGCFPREIIRSFAYIANGTATVSYMMFTERDFRTFLEDSSKIADVSFAALMRIGICFELVFQNSQEIGTVDGSLSGEYPCNPENPTSTVRAFTMYPEGNDALGTNPYVIDPHTLGINAVPISSRRQVCINSAFPCARLAGGDLALDFIQRCAEGKTLQHGVNFTDALTNPITLDQSFACKSRAKELQTIFMNQCFNVYFAPNGMYCNFGWLAKSIWQFVVDSIRSVVYSALKTVADWGQKRLNQQSASNPISFNYPIAEANATICEAEKIIGSALASLLGLATDDINLLVALITDNTEDKDLIATVETQVGSLIFTTSQVLLLPQRMVNAYILTLITLWNKGLTADVIGADLRGANGKTSGITLIVEGLVGDAADVVVGLLESILALCETGEDVTTGKNPFSPMANVVSAFVNLAKNLRNILQLVVNMVMLIIEAIFGFLGASFGNQEAAKLFVDSVVGIFNAVEHFLEAIADMIALFLSNLPGVGKTIHSVITVMCVVVGGALSAIASVINGFCHVSIFGHHLCHGVSWGGANWQCGYTPPTGNAAVGNIAQVCIHDNQCNATSTCLQANGELNTCATCSSSSYTCSRLYAECICGTDPTNFTECSTVSDCSSNSNSNCALTTTVGGDPLTIYKCSDCDTSNPSYSLQCTELHTDDVNRTQDYCSCSSSALNYSDVYQFYGQQCSIGSLGTTCDYASTAGLAIGVTADSPIATFGGDPIPYSKIFVGPAVEMCNTSVAGRCLNTYGMFYPATCVCQANFEYIERSTRRWLLEDGSETATIKAFPDPYQMPNMHTQEGFAQSYGTCEVDEDCTLSEYSACVMEAEKGKPVVPCAQCAESLGHKAVSCNPDSKRCTCSTIELNTIRKHNRQTRARAEFHSIEDEEQFVRNLREKRGVSLRSTAFETNGMVFGAIFHGEAWEGDTFCESFMRELVRNSPNLDSETSVHHLRFDNFTAFVRAIPELTTNSVAMATAKDCLRKRETAYMLGHMTGLPINLNAGFSWWDTFRTGVDMGKGMFYSYMATSVGKSKAEMTEELIKSGIDPGMAAAIYDDWEPFYHFLANEADFAGTLDPFLNYGRKLERDPTSSPFRLGLARVIKQVGTIAKGKEKQQLFKAVSDIKASLPEFGAAVQVAYKRFEFNKDRYYKHKYDHKNVTRPAHLNAFQSHAKQFSHLVKHNTPYREFKRVTNFAGMRSEVGRKFDNVWHGGRRLMQLFSWNADKALSCNVIAAVGQTATVWWKTLEIYYTKNFTKSVLAWEFFNKTGPTVIESSRGKVTWRTLFAVDQFETLVNGIKHTTVESFMNSLDFFLKCDIERTTLCPVNNGFLKHLYFVVIAMIVFTKVYKRLLPFGSVWTTLSWVFGFPAIMFMVVYEISPMCIGAIPGCLVDDLTDDLFLLFAPLHKNNIIVESLTNYANQDLQDKCAKSPYHFNTVLNNIGYSIASEDRNTLLWHSTNNTILRGLFYPYPEDTYVNMSAITGVYNATQDQILRNYRTCNFYTSLLHAALVIIGLTLGFVMIRVVIGVVRLLSSVVFLVYQATLSIVFIYDSNPTNIINPLNDEYRKELSKED